MIALTAHRRYRDTLATAMTVLDRLSLHGGRETKARLAYEAEVLYTQKVWGYLVEKGLVMMSLEDGTFREGPQQFVYLTDEGRRVLKEWQALRKMME